ncbi:Fic family protein [Sphingobacterium luzhongxinii]|uniref:Fic family protein n=1 Tax=Sphingobacterium luzhongxinii TaxID=2654181 RepID=UPI0013DD70BA|nr:hypothetical protein [Sphingobacterium sp. xlx-73]
MGRIGDSFGVELAKKTLRTTLLLAIAPGTVDDVTDILGYKSKPRFREVYVKPLRDGGPIEYTLEEANNPNQKYRITQRGINFLMGSAI